MIICMGNYENRHKEPREIFISHHKIKKRYADSIAKY